MLHKNLKLAIYGGLLFAAFSCAKKTEDTPAPLSSTEAKTELTTADADYSIVQAEVQVATAEASEGISSLNSINSGSGGGLMPAFKFSAEEDGEVFQETANILGNSILPIFKNPGARIPVDFATSKGVWEYKVTMKIEGSGTYTYAGYSGSFIQTSKDGNAIVIKFPSKRAKGSLNSESLNIVNDAIYTISDLATQTYDRQYCDRTYNNGTYTGVLKTRKDTSVTSLKANLVISGKKVMSYEYSTSINQSGNTGSASGKMEYGDGKYKAEYNISASDMSVNYSYFWLKEGNKVFGQNYGIDYIKARVETTECNTSSSSSNDYVNNIKKYRYDNIAGKLTFKSDVDFEGYWNAIAAKIQAKDTSAFRTDTILLDKHFKAQLVKTNGGNKIGDIVLRVARTKQYGYYSSTNVYFIIYTDGTREELTKRFKSTSSFISFPLQ